MNQYKYIVPLNGEWQFIKDKDSEYSIEQIKNKIAADEYSGIMDIPQNWQLAGLNNFNGSVWFIRAFESRETGNDLKILKFYGIDYFTDLWLNDRYLGNHTGYFQPFYFNITPIITLKDNLLIVRVTSPLEEPGSVWPLKKKLIKGIFNHHDCRPGGWSLEHGQDQNTGGIWNIVEIIYSKKIYIDHVKVTSKVDKENSRALIIAELFYESSFQYNYKSDFKFSLVTPSAKVIEKTYGLQIKSGKDNVLVSFYIENPEYWWSWDTGEQNMYSLVISGANNNPVQVLFGIKEVLLDENNQFFINDKRLFLRGTNIIPTQFLSELTYEKLRTQISLMKTANINAVRIHAHVNRKEFYDECDRQGILVWQDFALQWTYDESSEFITDACRQIRDMVRLNCNHPSIAFWCCHNEPGEQINTLDPFLYDSVLSEDNSRIIRKASNYEEHPYDGWYWGKPEHFEAAPMGPIVTEYGAQGIPEVDTLMKVFPDGSIYPPDWELWKYHNFQYVQTFLIAGVNKGNSIEEFIRNSQDYQAYLIRTAIDSYRRKKNNGISAIFQFMFVDCWPSITWSVVDYYGNKKKAYQTLRTAYQPIYISVKMRQEKYFSGDKLNLDFWIINDTYKCYDKAKLVIDIAAESLWELTEVKIEEDSIKKYDWEKLDIVIPEVLAPGVYELKFSIKDENTDREISINKHKIEILEHE